ncbi:MAG: 30S ribosomal protein S8 [Gammaproteobacteria bacterium]|jgi:small subunit ribosomal protein S8|nr:30S ribosomal protein S8 [Gammaproteobacteria bacterium]
MTMTDPIADMLTRVRNGLQADKTVVRMPASRVKEAIAGVLKDEGYVNDFRVIEEEGKPTLEIDLRYYEDKPVIDHLSRISKPGRRVYRNKDGLPKVRGGLGVAIVSTSQGIMTDRAARKAGVGGEVLCYVA